jgi:hypothetical protein
MALLFLIFINFLNFKEVLIYSHSFQNKDSNPILSNFYNYLNRKYISIKYLKFKNQI